MSVRHLVSAKTGLGEIHDLVPIVVTKQRVAKE